MKDLQIFVVEDDAIIALRSFQLLTKSGYNVPQMFSSGEELLEHLAGHPDLPDLILMDIGLAGKLDGLETARSVREKYGVPVIFVSSYSDDAKKARAQEISPWGYVDKPVIERLLVETIGNVLRAGVARGLTL